jgi:methionyl-tRNA formyltransferase
MNVVFFGTPDFAVPSLEALVGSRHRVLAVVTVPDTQKGRGMKLLPPPVKTAALRAGLPVLQPESLRDPAFHAALAAYADATFVIVAFRILPPEVFALPRGGCFNLHASLLPRYRGAAPINRAIMAGETETGLTTFLLQEKVDTGGILLQRCAEIGPDTTAGELSAALAVEGAQLVLETLDGLEAHALEPRAQDHALATPAPKIFRDQCRIDWTLPARRVHDAIRGLSPSPAAWTTHGIVTLKLLRSRPVAGDTAPESVAAPESIGAAPGSVRVAKREMFVACADAWLEVLELQQEGKRALGAEEFLRGYRFGKTDILL